MKKKWFKYIMHIVQKLIHNSFDIVAGKWKVFFYIIFCTMYSVYGILLHKYKLFQIVIYN